MDPDLRRLEKLVDTCEPYPTIFHIHLGDFGRQAAYMETHIDVVSCDGHSGDVIVGEKAKPFT